MTDYCPWAMMPSLMRIIRAAAWYQLADLKVVVRRAGFLFLLTDRRARTLLDFLTRFIGMFFPRPCQSAHEPGAASGF